MDAQRRIHVWRKKRERGTEKGSQDGVGGEDAGGEDDVRVNEVVEDGEEDEDHAEAKGGAGDDADDPVDADVVCPGEPKDCIAELVLGSPLIKFLLREEKKEEKKGEGVGRRTTNGHAARSDNRRWETRLGRRKARLGLLHHLDIPLIIKNRVRDSGHHAHADTQECQSANTRTPPADFLKDDGESGEEHVQRAVDNGHVDGEQQDNGLAKEEDKGPREGRLEGFAEADTALLGVGLRAVAFARELGELGGAAAE